MNHPDLKSRQSGGVADPHVMKKRRHGEISDGRVLSWGSVKRAALYMRALTVEQHPETQFLVLRQMGAQRGFGPYHLSCS